MLWTNRRVNTLALTAVAVGTLLLGARSQDPAGPSVPQSVPLPSASPAEATQSPAEKQKRAQPEFLVLIDASHGGDDRGVVFAPRIFEKDITLTLARDLRRELEDRGIPVRLLRESDSNLSLDRRAEIANEQRVGIYVALHAGLPGRGVRVYAPMVPASVPGASKDRVVAWETAQSGSLERSKALAKTVSRELKKKNFDVSSLRAPLRPLSNILEPAIAVELSPEKGEVRSLENARRQNGVASAVASGIAQMRGQMGAHP
jgi:N-acetylmuramoyl-L-alanine amidase